jgi:hypothetical protein
LEFPKKRAHQVFHEDVIHLGIGAPSLRFHSFKLSQGLAEELFLAGAGLGMVLAQAVVEPMIPKLCRRYRVFLQKPLKPDFEFFVKIRLCHLRHLPSLTLSEGNIARRRFHQYPGSGLLADMTLQPAFLNFFGGKGKFAVDVAKFCLEKDFHLKRLRETQTYVS